MKLRAGCATQDTNSPHTSRPSTKSNVTAQVHLDKVESFIQTVGRFEDAIFQKRARLLAAQRARRERDKQVGCGREKTHRDGHGLLQFACARHTGQHTLHSLFQTLDRDKCHWLAAMPECPEVESFMLRCSQRTEDMKAGRGGGRGRGRPAGKWTANAPSQEYRQSLFPESKSTWPLSPISTGRIV